MFNELTSGMMTYHQYFNYRMPLDPGTGSYSLTPCDIQLCPNCTVNTLSRKEPNIQQHVSFRI